MKPTPETTDPVQRAATARPMGVRLGAGIVSCALLGAGLLFVPTTAQAADAVYSVTDASDDGMDPVPGSLRYAFEEIAADSAAGGPAKDYVVEIAADVDTIELETDLEAMLLEGAKSFTLRSLGAEHSLIDMGENAVQVSAEGGDTGVSFSDVDFVNGHVLGARFAEGGTLTLSDVSVSGVEQGLIDGASATTLANSTLVDSDWQVIGAEGGELLLNTSEFSNAPVSADLPGGDALVKGSRFHSNTLDEVLQVTGAVGDQEELQSFVFQGNSVVGNQAGGVRVSHAVETQVTDSTFEDNQGTSGISVEGADVPGSTLVVSDVTFTGNSYAEAPLMVIGSLHAATVANSTFVGNSGEQSGTIRFDAALEEQGATLTEDLLAPRTFRVADNVLQSNDSHYESVVTVGEWLQHVGAAVNVERNLFAENISQSAASDIDIEQLGEGHEDSDEVLRLVDNTFTGSMSLPGKGQSIHLGWVDGARVEVHNNTFDVEADGEPALHIDDLDSNGELDIAFATFSGGGVRVGHYEDI